MLEQLEGLRIMLFVVFRRKRVGSIIGVEPWEVSLGFVAFVVCLAIWNELLGGLSITVFDYVNSLYLLTRTIYI